MNKYLVRNFKWIENLGKVPAKVYRLGFSYCYSVIVILSQLLLFIVQLARRGFVGRCNGLARWALKLSHWRAAIGSADWRVAHP